MKKSHEQKNNFIQRLLTSTLKFTKDNNNNSNNNIGYEIPINKFNYELPNSFLQAADNARINAGYDILPRFLRRSASASSSSASSHCTCKHLQTVSDIFRSTSHKDINNIPTKKIPFRRTPRERVNQQHHSTAPLLFTPRPAVRMVMGPNFMLMNRYRRPLNMMPIRTPVRMPQRPTFQFRFR
ncbi:unnamed protein product [Adineta steineri]|uniref:Uncharacterized protein n=1 Tax=Adineta steineri TaxID=433720 RepID=A0A814GTL7_9BILA|nr:unnamed protein product [Adineta steineri]CAF3746060.1 unnamed protein product [Adineta steineri]